MAKSKYWNEHLAPRYQEVYDQNHDAWFDDSLTQNLTECELELKEADKEYKTKHNKFTYWLLMWIGLPLSFLLIIPAYWAWTKFKELRNNKNQLLKVIAEKKEKKLAVHKEIMNTLPYHEIEQQFSEIIPYQPMGTIPQSLIQQLQANSLFDLQGLDISHNTYNSNWAILDHNKIVINSADQSHRRYMKTYTGSVSVPYCDKDGNAASVVVSASYSHPAYEIIAMMKSYFFMQSCSNLEFEYAGKSNALKAKHYNKKNNYASLENSEFEKAFKWERTDDLQFRMVFTPYTQEQFLANVNKKDVTSQYKWEKIGPFFGNQLANPTYVGAQDCYVYADYKFASDPYQTLENLKNDIFKSITDYYYDLFKDFNYYWLTTILQSEDHSVMIHDAYQGDILSGDTDDLATHLFFHYVLNRILKQSIISRPEIGTFNSLFSGVCEKLDLEIPYQLYRAPMNGLTYDLIPKVHYESVYCPQANRYVEVPIKYIDYISAKDEIQVIAGYVPTKYYYRFAYGKLETNIDDPLITDFIFNIFSDCRVRIDQNILAISFDKYLKASNEDIESFVKLLTQNHN